jgi:hypothetical protein
MMMMMMMIFLDALYIACCNFYRKREKGMFKMSGLILLTATFEFNVVLATLILPKYYSQALSVAMIYKSRYYIVALSFIFFVSILYFRYFRITSYEEASYKLLSLTEGRRRAYYFLSGLYVVASFLVPIALAIAIGRSHK